MRLRDLPFFWVFHMLSESRAKYKRVLSYIKKYPSCSIHASVTMGGNINLSKHVKVNDNALLWGNITIGKASLVNSFTVIASAPETHVRIGSFCSIANKCSIHAGNHPVYTSSTFKTTKGFYADVFKNVTTNSSSITIGSDVWIGANVSVLSGVTIGHGAVIGAGAVVTKDIPPYAIAVGVPAQVKSFRFRKEVIDWLLTLCWWEWADQKILANKAFFEQDLTLINDEEFEQLKRSILP